MSQQYGCAHCSHCEGGILLDGVIAAAPRCLEERTFVNTACAASGKRRLSHKDGTDIDAMCDSSSAAAAVLQLAMGLWPSAASLRTMNLCRG